MRGWNLRSRVNSKAKASPTSKLGATGNTETLAAIRAALDKAGVAFLERQQRWSRGQTEKEVKTLQS